MPSTGSCIATACPKGVFGSWGTAASLGYQTAALDGRHVEGGGDIHELGAGGQRRSGHDGEKQGETKGYEESFPVGDDRIGARSTARDGPGDVAEGGEALVVVVVEKRIDAGLDDHHFAGST